MNSLKTGIRLTTLALLLASCAMDMGQGARYGAYGGAARERQPELPFSIEDTYRGKRWFPTYVRYAPDGTHLLVSLCHVKRPELCRIGKYFIDSNEWEILPFEDKRTYRWPVYHPEGREIVVSTGACDEKYRCDIYQHVLARIRPDGSGMEFLADIAAKEMSFSSNGRKLIYWRLGGMGPQGRRAEFSNIYEMDWSTRTERALTQMIHNGPDSRPFFVDDGEAFVYFDYEGRNPTMRYVSLKDVPLTPYTQGNFTRLWPRDDPEWRGGQNKVFDVASDNRLLYFVNLALRRAGGDLSVMIKDPKYRDSIYLLLRARHDSKDSGEYAMPSTPFDAALSPDAKRVAFLDGGSPVSSAGVRLGLIDQGPAQHPISIDWPKLELKPGRQTVAKY